MIKRLLLWLGMEVPPSKRVEEPPRRYYRCGTMYLRSSPEGQRRLAQAWREEDARFVAWVEAHPHPKAEWLDEAQRVRARLSNWEAHAALLFNDV